jgi:hypothetical protein
MKTKNGHYFQIYYETENGFWSGIVRRRICPRNIVVRSKNEAMKWYEDLNEKVLSFKEAFGEVEEA